MSASNTQTFPEKNYTDLSRFELIRADSSSEHVRAVLTHLLEVDSKLVVDAQVDPLALEARLSRFQVRCELEEFVSEMLQDDGTLLLGRKINVTIAPLQHQNISDETAAKFKVDLDTKHNPTINVQAVGMEDKVFVNYA